MRRLHAMLATAAAATTTIALLAGGANTASASTFDIFGCESGYVCIFTYWDATMTDRYYNYGTYNLSNKIGLYWVDNNQTGGAGVDLCYNYGGTNCYAGPSAGYERAEDLTPINSIVLHP